MFQGGSQTNWRSTSSISSTCIAPSFTSFGKLSATDKGLPTQYWVQRFVDKVTMTLYLTPGAAQDGNYINFYYTKRIDDVGAYTNATDVPYRFVPCMISL